MKYALFFLMLVSCAGVLPPVQPRNTPIYHLQIQADSSFGSRQRALIGRAIDNLEYQTAGLLGVSVSYTPTVEEMNLLRVQSDFENVISMDASWRGKVYGYTSIATGRMFLVDDRLDDDDVSLHVMMHEILHRVGLDHIDTSSSVMFGFTHTTQHVTCLDRWDAKEFCRVFGCEAERLNYCGR